MRNCVGGFHARAVAGSVPIAVIAIGSTSASALALFLVLAIAFPLALDLAPAVVVFLLEGPALTAGAVVAIAVSSARTS